MNMQGLEFPDMLRYAAEHSLWLREEADGNVTLGLTAYGCALYGQIFALLPSASAPASSATAASAWWNSPRPRPRHVVHLAALCWR